MIDCCKSNVLIEAKRKTALSEEGAQQVLFSLKGKFRDISHINNNGP